MRALTLGTALTALLTASPGHAAPFGGGFPITRPSDVFPVSELAVGQRGVGYTVFVGSEVKPFDAEILGLLEGMLGPHRPVILARLTGKEIEATGVIAGMSGSPVFIGDRLLGAVSYRFGAFAKEAIAGITPIESMLEIYGKGTDARGPMVESGRGEEVTARGLLGRERQLPRLVAPSQPEGGLGPTRIETPVVLSGFSELAAQRLSEELRGAGLVAVAGGGGSGRRTSARALGRTYPNQLDRAGLATAAPIAPGAPIAAVLMSGDLFAAATGTVTLVDGDLVLAFGHPFFGYGHVQFPMATAAILNTLASASGSYKQAATAIEVGTIDDDRLTAIGGRIGKLARMVPVHVSVLPAGRSRAIETNVEVVDHEVWTPTMLRAVIETAGSGRLSSEAGGTFETTTTFRLANGRELTLVDTYAAPPPVEVASEVAADLGMVAYALARNNLEPARFDRIDVSMRARPAVEVTFLEEIVPESSVVRPGQALRVQARLRPYRGAATTTEVVVPIPRSAEGSLELFVGGALELDRRDAKAFGDRPIRDLDDLVRVIAERRPGGGLYARTYSQEKGLKLGAEILPAFPVSRRMTFDAPTGIVRREITEHAGPGVVKSIPSFVAGSFTLTLRVVAG
ncbi:MAG: hypothetical protein HYV07_21870 [Deltaproteobacteria bacterium]|nr:hypothetical protein [Deltaproteobacteria bacterium]